MIFGANTYRQLAQLLGSSAAPDELDPVNARLRSLPATVLSSTLKGPLDWPDATVVSGDAVEVVARLKKESEVPLRSNGSLSLNRALMAAGLVDYVQLTLFLPSAVRLGRNRSSRMRPTSTSSWSRARRSTATSSSSSTDPHSIDLYGFEEDPRLLRSAYGGHAQIWE